MTIYLLAERLWIPNSEFDATRFARTADTESIPIRIFADPTQAELERQKLEAQARVDRIPFAYGSTLEEWTSFGPHQLFDWLLDAGLEPLPNLEPTQEDCIRWWRREQAEWTDSQREKIWEALDRVRFFEVIEEEMPH